MEQRGSPLGSPENVAATSRAVQAMFARIAPRYDFLNHFLSAGFDLRWRRAAAEAVRSVLERPGSLAADLCCGTGDLTFALARLSRGLVVGADFCAPMISLAEAKRARGAARHPAQARFIEADTLSLPFGDHALDLVSAAFGFRNLADYDRGLAEMHRVLKPGGVMAILEFSRVDWPVIGPVFRFYFRRILPRLGTVVSGVPGPYQYLPDSVRHFPDQESLAGKLREAGFHDVRYRNFLGGAAALHLGVKPGFRKS
jgi:demethylmenaquinone methyltransferase / 2-methoxy-6-polyprenyl-1,4-benzoquinol methylase